MRPLFAEKAKVFAEKANTSVFVGRRIASGKGRFLLNKAEIVVPRVRFVCLWARAFSHRRDFDSTAVFFIYRIPYPVSSQ